MKSLLRARSLGILAGGAALIAALCMPASTAQASGSSAATVTYSSLTTVGTTNARAVSKTKSSSGSGSYLLGADGNLPRTGGPGAPGGSVPTSNFAVQAAKGMSGSTGFSGITGSQQAAANGAYDLEPPDQALCSNGTYVVEAVNNAYAVYSPSGSPVLGPIATTALFGIPPEQPNGAGSFVSDPRCFYDSATNRWFVVELSIPNFFAPHQHASKSYELIAVSQTADPTGAFTTFSIDTTDQSDAGCPCFGDYPMLGVDANGIYLTTNEFPIYKSGFNGVQLYAMSKQGLVAATDGTASAPTVVHFGALASPFPAEGVGETYHLSPALTPSDGSYDTANGGTELFTMSDAFPVSSDLLSVYSLTNTSSLATASPALTLSSKLVTLGQYYQFPETGLAVPQKAAKSSSQTPLLNYVESQTGTTVPAGVLQADFDAVEETTYANGELFTELSNASSPTSSVGTTSAEWFVISATGALLNEGNLAVSGQSLLYPDLVVNGSGVGDMVFTLTGSSYYPSAAYVPFGSSGPSGKVTVAGAGSGPEDGFTCYAYFVGANYGGCRWGDFSGGVAVGSKVWMATEYIPPASTRDFLTNWGTFVFQAPAG